MDCFHSFDIVWIVRPKDLISTCEQRVISYLAAVRAYRGPVRVNFCLDGVHLGIAAHAAGRLDEARERLEESSRLRREIGALAGLASNMVGLACIAAAQDRRSDALATLDEAYAIAQANGAHAIVRHIERTRAEMTPPAR